MIFELSKIEKIIGYSFKDKDLLRQCFTHASYAHEHGEKDNEVLEFFGDAIIQFIVTEYLVDHCKGDEGDFTKYRSLIVSKDPLLNSVKELNLGEYMLLSEGQRKTAKESDKMYSSLYEALCAGIYKDSGLDKVKKFVYRTIISDFEELSNKLNEKKTEKESKTKLQEYIQKHKIGSILYQTLSKSGPDHNPEFRVALILNGAKISEGKGRSKKLAESEAAEKALTILKNQGGKQK
jgi:ribonuclease-3